MITLQDIEDIGFFWLQDVPDVLIGQNDTALDVCVDVNQVTIFEEKIYADEDGNVVLRNLPDLIEPFFDNDEFVDLWINQVQVRVYFSRRSMPWEVNEPGNFEASLPRLLSVNSCMFCVPGYDVRIPFLLAIKASHVVKITCYGMNSLGYLYSEEYSQVLENSFSKPSVSKLIIQTSDLLATETMKNMLPVGIVCEFNGRVMARVQFVQGCYTILKFVNNFNQEQSLAVPGFVKSIPEYDRVVGMVWGKKVTAVSRETVKYSIECAPVSVDLADQLMDAAASVQCHVLEGNNFFPVTLDEVNIEVSDDRTEFCTPKVTFYRSEHAAKLQR